MLIQFPVLLVRSTRAAALALVVALALPAAVAAQSEASAAGMVGTWRVQVSAVNCSTGQTMGPSFASMLTFARGGTLTGTTRNPAFQPGQRSSDFGVWQQTGSNTYSADSEAFLLFNSSAPPLFQAGTQKIIQSITLNGNSFESVAITRFYDTAGNIVSSGCAHAVATRYQ